LIAKGRKMMIAGRKMQLDDELPVGEMVEVETRMPVGVEVEAGASVFVGVVVEMVCVELAGAVGEEAAFSGVEVDASGCGLGVGVLKVSSP
jgi:hypothetical protein